MSTPDHSRMVMAYVLIPPMPYTTPVAASSSDGSSDVTMEDLLVDQDFLPDESGDSSSEFEPASDSGSGSRPSGRSSGRAAQRNKPRTTGPLSRSKPVQQRGYAIPEASLPVVCDGGSRQCHYGFHTNDHSANILLSPATTHCNLLADLNMVFTPFGFACRTHQCLIPPGFLADHIEKRHKPAIPKKFRSAVIVHLFDSHRLTASMPPPQPPPAGLTQLIPGMAPTEAYGCPIEGCDAWHTKAGLYKHRERVHADVPTCNFKATEKRFIIRPFYNLMDAYNPLRMQAWTFVPGWSLLSTSPAITTAASKPARQVAPQQAQFLIDLGWAPFVTQLREDIRLEIARFPTPALAKNPPPFSNSTLEEGLVRLSRLYKRYLFDANDFVGSKNDQLVYVLTHGTRAHFTPLRRLASYPRYIRPVVRCVSMILRFLHVHQKGKRNLGQFDIFATEGQLAAAQALYKRITGHEKNGGTLTKLLHNLLVLLVRHEIKSVDKIACPTDVSLCLGSMVNKSTFEPTNYITGSCAVLQHNFFAILFQYARVKASNMPGFSPHDMDNFLKPLADQHLPDIFPIQQDVGREDGGAVESEEDEGDEDEDEDEEGEVDVEEEEAGEDNEESMDFSADVPELVGENLNGGYTPSLPHSLQEKAAAQQPYGNPAFDSILKILLENKCFVQPTADFGYTTPYTRMKSVWFRVFPEAQRERSDTGFTFDSDGQAINIPDAQRIFHRIPFSEFGSLARDAIANFTSAAQSLLPSSGKSLYDDFTSNTLTDDLNRQESIFRQPMNQSWLDPMVGRAFDEFHQQSLNKPRTLSKIISEEKHILSAFAAAFFLTSGIPPRSSQAKSLKYDWDTKTGSSRNLFIVLGMVALANPAAKQQRRNIQECLWVLPRSLAAPTMFFLGVVRPALVRLLSQLKEDVSEHSMYIFVHPFSVRNSLLWSGSDVNIALQKHMPTTAVKFTGTLLRNATTAMLRKFFPSLTSANQLPDSLLDQQSQHRRSTGDTHYGRDLDIPRSLSMTIDRARGYIATSQAVHALYGLGTPDESSQMILSSSHFFPNRKFEEAALMEARFQILSVYLGCGGDKGQLAQTVRNVLAGAPYITISNGMIGDRVLRHVLDVLLFGTAGPAGGTSPPPLGYTPEDVGLAVTLIIKALKEWLQGQHCDLTTSSLIDITAIQHFKACEKKAVDYLQKVKECYPAMWVQLSKDIIDIHIPKPVGLPDLALGTYGLPDHVVSEDMI